MRCSGRIRNDQLLLLTLEWLDDADLMAFDTASQSNGCMCKSIKAKILRSMAGDVPQALHRDHAPTASTKAIKSLSSYHYSAVISFEDDTRLIIGEKEIDIQRFSMLFYRGDMDHAGAGYTKCNGRLFLSISSKSFPVS